MRFFFYCEKMYYTLINMERRNVDNYVHDSWGIFTYCFIYVIKYGKKHLSEYENNIFTNNKQN